LHSLAGNKFIGIWYKDVKGNFLVQKLRKWYILKHNHYTNVHIY